MPANPAPPIFSRYYSVTGSNFSTNSASLVTITGLTSATLAPSTTYEVSARLLVGADEATNGIEYGLTSTDASLTVSLGLLGVLAAGTVTSDSIIALDTATGAFNKTTNSKPVWIHGFVTTSASGGTISLQCLKLVTGNASVKVNSFMRVTQVKYLNA